MSSKNDNKEGVGTLKRSDSVQQLRDMANTFTTKLAGFFHIGSKDSPTQAEFVSTDPLAGGGGLTMPSRGRSASNSSGSASSATTPTRETLGRSAKTPDMKPKKSKISSKIAKLRLPLISNNNNSNSLNQPEKSPLKSPTAHQAPAPSYPATSRFLSSQPTSKMTSSQIVTPSSSYMASGETTPMAGSVTTYSFSSSSQSSPDCEEVLPIGGATTMTATRTTKRHGRIGHAIGKAVAKIQNRSSSSGGGGSKQQQQAVNLLAPNNLTAHLQQCETDVFHVGGVGDGVKSAASAAAATATMTTACCSGCCKIRNKQQELATVCRHFLFPTLTSTRHQLVNHDNDEAHQHHHHTCYHHHHHHHQQHNHRREDVCSTCCCQHQIISSTTCSPWLYSVAATAADASSGSSALRRHSSLSGLNQQQALTLSQQKEKQQEAAAAAAAVEDEEGVFLNNTDILTTSPCALVVAEILSTTTNCRCCQHSRLIARLLGLDVLRRCYPEMERTVVTFDLELTGVPTHALPTVSCSSSSSSSPIKQSLNSKAAPAPPLPTLPGVPAYSKSAAQSQLFLSLLAYVKCPDTLPDELRLSTLSSSTIKTTSPRKSSNFDESTTFKGELLLEWLCSTIDRTHYLQYLVKNDLYTLALQFCTDLLALGVIRPSSASQSNAANQLPSSSSSQQTIVAGAMTTATASSPSHADASSLSVTPQQLLFKPDMNYSWSTFLASSARSFNGAAFPSNSSSPETETAASKIGGNKFSQEDVEAIIAKLKTEFADRLELSEKDHANKTARLRNRYEAEMRMTELKMSEMNVRIAQLEAENAKFAQRCKQLEDEVLEQQQKLQLKEEQHKKQPEADSTSLKHGGDELPDVVNPASSTSSGLDTQSTSSLVINLVNPNSHHHHHHHHHRSISPETSSISSMISSSGSHSPLPTINLPETIPDAVSPTASSTSCELPPTTTPVMKQAAPEISVSASTPVAVEASAVTSPPPPPPLPDNSVVQEVPLSITTPPPPPPLPSDADLSAPQPPAGASPPPPPPPPPPLPPGASPPPPPPPGGAGGPPPPPPPPPSAAIKKVPRKKAIKVGCEMKPLFWRRIQFMASQPAKPNESSTMWFTLQEPVVDVKEIEKHFSRATSSASNRLAGSNLLHAPVGPDGRPTSPMRLSELLSAATSSKGGAVSEGRPGTLKKLLEPRRSQAIGIAISSYRLTFDQIREVLVNGRLTAVKLTLLETLDKHRPTAEEIDSLVEHVREFGEEGLDKPDLFCYRLTRIPRYDLRLNSLIVRLTLPDGLQSFEAKLSAFRLTCDRVRSSDQLRYLFGVILAVGNVLNAGNTSRGQADGFQLDVLPKLKEIKSSDGSLTLLHFIVNELLTHVLKTVASGNMERLPPDPDLPTQPELHAAADVDLASLRVDLDRLKSDLERCQRFLELIQQGDEQPSQQPSQNSTSTSPAPPANVLPTPPTSDGDTSSSQGDASPAVSISPPPPPPAPSPKLVEDGFTDMLKNFIAQAQEDIAQTEQLMKDSETKFTSLVSYFALAGGNHDGPPQPPSATGGPVGPSPSELFAPLAAFSADVTAVYRRELARRRRLAVVAERRSQSVVFNSPQPTSMSQSSHPFFMHNHPNSAPHQGERTRPATMSVKDRLLRQGRLA